MVLFFTLMIMGDYTPTQHFVGLFCLLKKTKNKHLWNAANSSLSLSRQLSTYSSIRHEANLEGLVEM